MAAGIFVLGCLELCVWLIWLGLEGFAPGFAWYVAGCVVAMEVDEGRA